MAFEEQLFDDEGADRARRVGMSGNRNADGLADWSGHVVHKDLNPATRAIRGRRIDDLDVVENGVVIVRFDIEAAARHRAADIFPKRSIERNGVSADDRHALASAAARVMIIDGDVFGNAAGRIGIAVIDIDSVTPAIDRRRRRDRAVRGALNGNAHAPFARGGRIQLLASVEIRTFERYVAYVPQANHLAGLFVVRQQLDAGTLRKANMTVVAQVKAACADAALTRNQKDLPDGTIDSCLKSRAVIGLPVSLHTERRVEDGACRAGVGAITRRRVSRARGASR